MIEKFLNEVNNYNCIYNNDNVPITELSHYTSSTDAVINISRGSFWATVISDFADGDEGKLILRQINHIILKNCSFLNEEQIRYVREFIGEEDKISDFVSGHRTNVVSLSLNLNSSYLWENYAKDGYNIIFDKSKFIEDVHFITRNNQSKGGHYVKHAPVIYNTEKQTQIILEETKRILNSKSPEISEKRVIYWLLYHLMFIGNYYKRDDDKDQYGFAKEEEYRLSTNFIDSDEGNDIDLPVCRLNEANNKHYIELNFSPICIKRIICESDKAKKRIEGKISGIPIELKDYL